MTFTIEQLQSAAKELNQVMGLEPPIETDVEKDKLKAKVREYSFAVLADDELSDETAEVVDHFLEQQ